MLNATCLKLLISICDILSWWRSIQQKSIGKKIEKSQSAIDTGSLESNFVSHRTNSKCIKSKFLEKEKLKHDNRELFSFTENALSIAIRQYINVFHIITKVKCVFHSINWRCTTHIHYTSIIHVENRDFPPEKVEYSHNYNAIEAMLSDTTAFSSCKKNERAREGKKYYILFYGSKQRWQERGVKCRERALFNYNLLFWKLWWWWKKSRVCVCIKTNETWKWNCMCLRRL